MAVWIAAAVLFVRIFSPHDVFQRLHGKPLIPAVTALLLLVVGVSVLRKRTVLQIPPHFYVQVLLLLWVTICLVVNEGAGTAKYALGSSFVEGIIFYLPFFVLVDRLDRLKVIVIALLGGILVIGSLSSTQVRGKTECAEWKLGDMANLKFTGLPCVTDAECYASPPTQIFFDHGVHKPNYRCENRGIFGIPAYQGRVRWPGLFDDSNNFGGMTAACAPLLLALIWGIPGWHRRAGWPLLFLAFVLIVRWSGSRGALVALAGGLMVSVPLLWRIRPPDGLMKRSLKIDKVLLIVGAIGAVSAIAVVSVRKEHDVSASTDDSDRHRRDAMQLGYSLWGSYPLFGVGFGRFVHHNVTSRIGPHNAYLEIVGEAGSVGLLLFVLSVWLNFKGNIGSYLAARRARSLALERLAAGMLGYNAAATVALTFFLHGYGEWGWLLVVMLNVALTRAAHSEAPDYKLRLTHWDVLICVPIGLLLMGLFYLGMLGSYTMK